MEHLCLVRPLPLMKSVAKNGFKLLCFGWWRENLTLSTVVSDTVTVKMYKEMVVLQNETDGASPFTEELYRPFLSLAQN